MLLILNILRVDILRIPYHVTTTINMFQELTDILGTSDCIFDTLGNMNEKCFPSL